MRKSETYPLPENEEVQQQTPGAGLPLQRSSAASRRPDSPVRS